MAQPKKNQQESYISSDYGDIGLQQQSNKVQIQFKKKVFNDQTQNIPNEIYAQLHLSTLELIKQDPIYIDSSAKVDLLTYLNTWVLRSKHNRLIAFRHDTNQALVFTCNTNDVVKTFTMLFKLLSPIQIELIRESEFNEFINNTTHSLIQDLLKLPNVTKSHLELIYKNQEHFQTLVKNNISTQALFELTPDSFSKVLELADSMHLILNFVTMRQILGKSVTPPLRPSANVLDLQPKHELSDSDFPINIEGVLFNLNQDKHIFYQAYYAEYALLPNLTLHKLKLFLNNPKEFNKLRALGLDISEITNIPETRLTSIFNNFYIFELSTCLVPIRTVVGLTALEAEKKFAYTFLKPAVEPVPVTTEPEDSFSLTNRSKL